MNRGTIALGIVTLVAGGTVAWVHHNQTKDRQVGRARSRCALRATLTRALRCAQTMRAAVLRDMEKLRERERKT